MSYIQRFIQAIKNIFAGKPSQGNTPPTGSSSKAPAKETESASTTSEEAKQAENTTA